MKQVGLYLLLFGVGSFVLNLMGLEFKVLRWIDLWGPTTGYLIRGGMAATGLVLLVAGRATEDKEAQPGT